MRAPGEFKGGRDRRRISEDVASESGFEEWVEFPKR